MSMVLESTSTKTKLDSSPSNASPDRPGTKRVAEAKDKAEPEAKLADLCDEDKAKVARLVNQVLVAFREIHRLRDVLEDERVVHASITSKLREQNREVAAEVSQLRLKLASMQNLLSPLQLHKVILKADKTAPILTPIRETKTDISEAGFQMTAVHADCSELRDVSTMKERICDQLLTSAEVGSAPAVGIEKDESLGGNFIKTDVQISSGLRGKENHDPGLTGDGTELAEPDHLTEQEALPQKRRPLPRPLPDLVLNILHTQKEVVGSTSHGMRPRHDTTVSPDRSTVVNIPGQEQESSSTDAERGKFLAPALERSYPEDTVGRQSEVLKCPDVAGHKNLGESDESLRSSKIKKKMRFDPTAGEEGEFYYASDLENIVYGNKQDVPVHQEAQADRRVQSHTPSINLTSSRCSKALTRKKVGRDKDDAIRRDHSFHIVASMANGTIPVNRQNKLFTGRGGPNCRDEDISTQVYTTDEDYGPDPSSRTRVIRLKNKQSSARQRSPSCSKDVHICMKCSSQFVRKLPRHRHGKQEWNEIERRQRYEIDDVSPTSLFCSPTKTLARCVPCSHLDNFSLTKQSRKWCETETGEDSEGQNQCFNPEIHSENKKTVRCKKHIHQTDSKRVGPRGHTRRKGSGEFITGAPADDTSSKPRVIAYKTSGEDSESQSPTAFTSAFTIAGLQRMPRNPHETTVGARRDNGEENAPLDEDQSSEIKNEEFLVNHEKFPVNHEKFQIMLQSESENSEFFKCSSPVDEKVLSPNGDRRRINEESCCRASTEEKLDLGSTVASTCLAQTEVEVKSTIKTMEEIPITSPNVHCKVIRPERLINKSNRTVSRDKCAEQGESRSANVETRWEDLLGRFIRSNAECAAELIKCFQTKTTTTRVNDPDYSKRISDHQVVPERKANQSEEFTDTVGETCQMHQASGNMTLEQLTRCTGCLAVLKPEVSGSADKQGFQVKDRDVLCGKCSTSRALLKNPGLPYSNMLEGGKDPPPDTRTSTNAHVQGNAKLDDLSSGSLKTDDIRHGQNHERSTVADEASERKLEETEDWQIGLFDISLFHLVNDLEVDETEYWNQVNTPATDENIGTSKYDTRSKRTVLEKGRASTMTRWCHPKRNTNVNHFR